MNPFRTYQIVQYILAAILLTQISMVVYNTSAQKKMFKLYKDSFDLQDSINNMYSRQLQDAIVKVNRVDSLTHVIDSLRKIK